MTAPEWEMMKNVRNELTKCVLRKEFTPEVEVAVNKVLLKLEGLIKCWITHMSYIELNRLGTEKLDDVDNLTAIGDHSQSLVLVESTQKVVENSENTESNSSEIFSISGETKTDFSSNSTKEDFKFKTDHLPYDFTELFSSRMNTPRIESAMNGENKACDVMEILMIEREEDGTADTIEVPKYSAKSDEDINLKMLHTHENQLEAQKKADVSSEILPKLKLSFDELSNKR